MSPSIVELMYAVGATPVGRPNSAGFPDAAKSLPDFGSSYTPVVEKIAAMKPDLIIADAIIDAGPNLDALSALGVPIYALRIASFDDVVRAERIVGALTGHKSEGETQAQALISKLTAIKAKLPSTWPKFLVLVIGAPGQFVAEKNGSYLADVLQQLGATNLVTNEPDNFRFPGFTDYSPELIVQKNPDVIITMSLGGAPGTPTTIASIKADPALSTLTAVKQGRIFEVNPDVYLQSAGPRVSLMLDELPKLLYPTVFAAAR